jgi:hypothetical protein
MASLLAQAKQEGAKLYGRVQTSVAWPTSHLHFLRAFFLHSRDLPGACKIIFSAVESLRIHS